MSNAQAATCLEYSRVTYKFCGGIVTNGRETEDWLEVVFERSKEKMKDVEVVTVSKN